LIYAHSRTPRMNELKGEEGTERGMPAGPTAGDFQPASADFFIGTANQRNGRKDRSKPVKERKRGKNGERIKNKRMKAKGRIGGKNTEHHSRDSDWGRMDGCQSTADAPTKKPINPTKN